MQSTLPVDPSTPRFGTILSSRSNQCPPSELEVYLRRQCRCLKVVPHQLNGAHLVLPPASTGEATLAVRAYYASDLPPHKTTPVALTNHSLSSSSSLENDLDGLLHFQKSFALTIVFFVIGDEERDEHLNHSGSFVRRAMHSLTTLSLLSTNERSCNNTTRVLLVPSSDAAVESLVHFADALTPEKRQQKKAFFEGQRLKHFIPPVTDQMSYEHTAALQTADALRAWAFCNDVQEDQAEILISLSGNLQTIVEQLASGAPMLHLDPRTQDLLYQFFHGRQGESRVESQASPAGPRTNYMTSIVQATPIPGPMPMPIPVQTNQSHLEYEEMYQPMSHRGTHSLPPQRYLPTNPFRFVGRSARDNWNSSHRVQNLPQYRESYSPRHSMQWGSTPQGAVHQRRVLLSSAPNGGVSEYPPHQQIHFHHPRNSQFYYR